MLGETSLAGTVSLLEKPACLVGAEPERLTVTVANPPSWIPWENGPASESFLLDQPLGSGPFAGWWHIIPPAGIHLSSTCKFSEPVNSLKF